MSTSAERICEPAVLAKRLSMLGADFAVDAPASSGFEATVRSFRLGRSLTLAELCLPAHVARRARIRRDGSACYMVVLVVDGRAIVHQDGRQAEAEPGDLYVVNLARDFRIESAGATLQALHIDAAAFRLAFPEIDCCTAVALRPDTDAMRIVGDFIRNLFRTGDGFSEPARIKSADAAPHVLAIALAASAEAQAPRPSNLLLYQKERIKRFTRERLNDHELSCRMIADALHISQRYIYDLFSDEPLSLMRWIRRERLLRCRRELASPALRNRSVSEIAFGWGFIDLAHFSRAFTAEFGQSPRAFRQAQEREPAELRLAI